MIVIKDAKVILYFELWNQHIQLLKLSKIIISERIKVNKIVVAV